MNTGTIVAPVADALADFDTSEPIPCELLWLDGPCDEPADLRVLTQCQQGHSATVHWCAECYAIEIEDEAAADEYDDMICSACAAKCWVVIAEPIR